MKRLNAYKIFIFAWCLIVVSCHPLWAYIGPGAGFAFLGSAFVFAITFLMAFLTVAFWPLRWIGKTLLGKKISKKAKTRRLVILGLDGFDPVLTEKYIREGRLPNLKSLGEKGCYRKLKTTFPSISPVAWSTFQTGVNPGAHNIFDFLTRDKRMYLPDLSSMKIDSPKRSFSLGSWRIPLSKPEIRILRQSQPFWKILGKQGIFSSILRVPITCPPEKFEGNILAGMSTPDLKGSQGMFSFFSTAAESKERTGGTHFALKREGKRVSGFMEGPPHPFKKKIDSLRIPFSIEVALEKNQALLTLQKNQIKLIPNQFSDWIRLEFNAGLGVKIKGICRFYLKQMSPEVELYVSPVNIDPESPVMPISHPNIFSIYLSKLNGLFGTLGLMEDTWARNEKVLDDEAFLAQTYLTHEEREKMFFDSLEKTKEGVCVCVFDASDRIQHIFWRYIDHGHPSPCQDEKYREVIPQMYAKMDDLVGRTLKKIGAKDIFIVLSDHGFSSFKRCVHLNTWLAKEGYLTLKENKITGRDHFLDVDWSKTKAFAVGLSGLYFNRIGREKQGIVSDQEALRLKTEMTEKLLRLKDPANGQAAIRRIADTAQIYKGLYQSEAPDLIIGYEPGYRISWESVTGKMRSEVFEDNTKAWSGDHSIDSECVPGVFFCNRSIKSDAPDMRDIAPTVLDLFDVKIPSYMEGKPVL